MIKLANKQNGFWILVCLLFLLSSCTPNNINEAVIELDMEPESAVTLPDQVIRISDLGLGVPGISGKIAEKNLNWVDLDTEEANVLLVDAVPFLTTQSDLSNLSIYESVSLQSNAEFDIDLSQQFITDSDMLVMMLVVENQDCLIPGNQLFYCWDAELSSIAFSDASQSKVMDGQLLVWVADDGQSFPESIGADGLFFTDDDELLPLEPGYTLIDLGTKPFTFDHKGEHEMSLYSNYDPFIRDLSELSYTEAFQRVFNDMREGYAFNGVEGKEPDWDAVYELIYPQVQAAEESGDVYEWISALNAYTQQFSDSHVSISGDVVDEWVEELYSHGMMFYFTPLSNGDILKTYGPIHDFEEDRFSRRWDGEILIGIDDVPIEEQINNVKPLFGSFSNPEMNYRAKVHDITHIFNDVRMKYQLISSKWGNIEDDTKRYLRDSISAQDFYSMYYSSENPVTYKRIDSSIGVITIHSDNYHITDTLILFETALMQLSGEGVEIIILDLRDSEESRFMNYAGYFSNNSIELGEMEWHQFGESIGKLRTKPLVSIPSMNQYSFDKIAVLTGERCKDACEADVLALGRLPQTTIYGETSTFGSYAIVDPTTYTLPDHVIFNYSTGFTRDENGDFLIEGVGVPVDTLIEERLSTYLHDYDWRLPLLVNMLAYEEEMNIIPQSNPVPMELSDDEIDNLIDEMEQRDLEYLSVDAYPLLFQLVNYSYRVFVEDPGKLFISEKWCTDDPDLYLNKGEYMTIEFIVDGATVDESYCHTTIIQKNEYKCWVKYVVMDQWVPGTHHVEISSEYLHQYFFDGSNSYNQGKYVEEYTVVVKESE